MKKIACHVVAKLLQRHAQHLGIVAVLLILGDWGCNVCGLLVELF